MHTTNKKFATTRLSEFQYRLQQLIQKIMSISSHEANHQFIYNILNNIRIQTPISNSIMNIYTRLVETNYKIPHSSPNYRISQEDNIVRNMIQLISSSAIGVIPNTKSIGIDIGGGDGLFLHTFAKKYSLSEDNVLCIETQVDWSEIYNAHYTNTIYWDNVILPDISLLNNNIVEESPIFLFCKVSLHHMTDATIHNLFSQITERIKNRTVYLIVKEHDCITTEDRYIIEWEHHLYHIIDTIKKYSSNKPNTVSIYDEFSSYIATQCIDNFNFKSKEEWTQLFSEWKFTRIQELNRFFLPNIGNNRDVKNITNLYWAIYKLEN